MKSNIFITGFSGSGKTTIGRRVAGRLGWQFIDTDDEIGRVACKSVAAIFDSDGEEHFRKLEGESLRDISIGDRQVVSTGGGIVMDEENRRVMESNGVIVCLEATPETIHRRLEAEPHHGQVAEVRPMLAGPNPLGRIRSLKAERQFNYALAHWTVHTDRLAPTEVADEVVKAWVVLNSNAHPPTVEDQGDLAAMVRTSSGDYPIWVGWGILKRLGSRVTQIMEPAAAYIITDEDVHSQARHVQTSMEASGIPTHMFLIPPGEKSKTLETAQHIYSWLADRKAERGHILLAVGGGVVGDLAGFVAATYLRGMPLIQVPTSLLAMMDASIGGKVGVDLPQGKNLVGAFYQPQFVIADVETLRTLPQRERVSGWAEAIKHGLILDESLFRDFEQQRDSILALQREIATKIIRRSVAIKANVVSRDERETLGVRVLLNYGHTIGHALEVATSYRRFLHGEAISVGMMGAAHIGHAMGLMSQEEVDRQRSVLEAFGLPLSCKGVDIDVVIEAMRSDKKVAGSSIHWVLLDRIGEAVTRSDVPNELVRETLELLAS